MDGDAMIRIEYVIMFCVALIFIVAVVAIAVYEPRQRISHADCEFEYYTVMSPQMAVGFNGQPTTVIVPQSRKRHTKRSCREIPL